ncbi:MAG: hypothetical protein JJ975_05870 [Bacteroidia bacterium]|nr:hypothetical protein [Bacteroidia bacterium]
MENNNPDPKKALRVSRKYGDAEIILNLFSTQFWKDLFLNKNHIAWVLIAEFVHLNRYMLALSLGTIFRYKFGGRTNGFIISIMTLFMLISWNSAAVVWPVKPFMEFGMIFLPAFLDLAELKNILWYQVHSVPMRTFTLVYAAMCLFHAGAIAFGYGDKSDRTKRGNSFLYEFVFKRTSVGEFAVQGVIEPIIASLAGWYFFSQGDLVFSTYLWAASFCQGLIHTMDYANQQKLAGSV